MVEKLYDYLITGALFLVTIPFILIALGLAIVGSIPIIIILFGVCLFAIPILIIYFGIKIILSLFRRI